jgi:glycosyltransferase involved in cell wall biosynthesis
MSELSFSIRNSWAALRASKDWDVVVSATPPLSLGLGALAVAKARRIPLVWWVQDLHPEIAIALRLTSAKGATFRLLHRAHDVVLRNSHVVIAISEAQRRTLLSAYPAVQPERVVVVENPATHTQPPEPADEPRGDRIIIAYTGNLGLSQGLEHILDLACATQSLPVRFVLHGAGVAENSLRESAARRRLDNLEFSSFVTDDDYIALLRRSHVLLLVLRPEIDRYSFPSKLWTYFAAGRPILALAGRGGAVEETIRRSHAGTFAAWGDVPGSVAALTRLLDEPRRQEQGAAALAFYRCHCTPEVHANRLLDVIQGAVRPTK